MGLYSILGVEIIELKDILGERKQRKLIIEYKETNNPYLKEKLILHNLRLVKHIALKYRGRGVEDDDLFQMGSIGLIQALENYDISRGAKFSTYSYYHIQQSITRGIENEGKTIRLPSYVMEEINKLNRVKTRLYKELGRKPKVEELATSLNKDVKEIQDLLEVIQEPLSMNYSYNNGEDTTTLEETIEDNSKPVDETVEDKVFLEEFIRDFKEVAKKELTKRQYNIILMYYGVDNKEHTLEEIGQIYNISGETVRVERDNSLHILRNTKYCMELERELDQRTRFYTSIDYSLQGSKSRSNTSPVERIVLERQRILKDIKKMNRGLSSDY